ncbi:MAG: NtaA/DmoA family FMN-dependent monooxygenase [Comamonas sp.]
MSSVPGGTPAALHLALYVTETGAQLGAWRHPLAGDVPALDWRFYRDLARQAEAACIDFVFLADKLAIDDVYGASFEATVQSRAMPQHAEPLSIMAALAGATERIGLAGTVSATYADPYATARALATIDHLSGGRVGWNLVTSVSDSEARNFGRERHLDHDARYRKAEEFAQLLRKLWDSWGDGWRLADRASGQYADPGRLRYVDHAGEWFRVRGPLNVPRPPQGHPVQIQAGVSGNFQRTAAQAAEVIFAVQPDLARAQAFYADFKQRLAALGRDPDSLKILPGLVPVIGATPREARDLARELREKVLPRAALSFISASMNHDLSQYALHEPVPDIASRVTGSKGRFEAALRQAREQGLTLAEFGVGYAQSLSFFSPFGTAAEVADQIATWHQGRACDGFVVLPAIMPSGAQAFLSEVVPELQSRGIFRTAYPGRTLRDTLGLARPADGFWRG